MEFLRSLLTLPVIGIAALVVVIILFIVLGYVKAPPDTAIIISGLGKKPRIYVGKAGIRSPFLERMDKLLLKQISIDIKTDDYIPTQDFINIKVDAVAKVHVDMSKIDLAMTNFLNKTEEGRAVIAIYSHTGYLPATSSDYDNERIAQEIMRNTGV